MLLNKRFIPVYTGNMYVAVSKTGAISVYPCVYREHFLHPQIAPARGGLSLCIQGT